MDAVAFTCGGMAGFQKGKIRFGRERVGFVSMGWLEEGEGSVSLADEGVSVSLFRRAGGGDGPSSDGNDEERR